MEINLPLYDEYALKAYTAELLENVGKEHYRLLAYFSTLFENTIIIDFNTNAGNAAYALAYNEKNIVHTFDKVNSVSNKHIKECNNIKFTTANLFDCNDRETWSDLILRSAIIFMDVDPHSGVLEYEFYQFLYDHNYQGLLICDDIWYFKDMRDHFWSQVPEDYKYDLTLYGHWSGTGIITLNNIHVSQLMRKCDNNDWTMVTAYFNLTEYYDMNKSVRTKDFYMTHANACMSVPYNLVVYCDQGSLEQIKSLRPAHLLEKTKFFVFDFNELKFVGHPGYENTPFSVYRDRITQNRRDKPYQFDPRNNASYYLFCMARYLMLKHVITGNPFNSTHFAWINICIERMGFKNLIYLDEALAVHRDKFSTCYIDYLPKSLINNTHEYFRYGRCSMCSGFFTGNNEYMYRVCHEIEKQFLEYLGQGYGHADEQLYSPVYFKYPELFDQYYGDYLDMITDYRYVYSNPQNPLTKFIKNSFSAKFYPGCYKACKFLWNSYTKNKCKLDDEQLRQLSYYKQMSKHYINLYGQVNITPILQNKESTVITILYDVGNPKHIDSLFQKVQQWMALSFPVIIWTDNVYYDILEKIFHNKSNVKIYKRNIEEFPPNTYIDKITELYNSYPVYNRSREKDTIKYHMLMYSRPHMWAESIKENPFNTDTFICIDFGLVRFTRNLSVIEQWNVKDKVKMLMINPFIASDGDPIEYFHNTRHNVAGGLVTGKGENILKLIDLFNQEFKEMLDNNWCQLDEAIMACVVRKYPTLCDYSYGDYCGIISNYDKICDMTNVPNIIQKYLNNRLYEEAQTVINSIDYDYSETNRYLFVDYSVLTNYYSMGGFLNPIVKNILADLRYQESLSSINQRHANNLKYYKENHDN